MDDLPADQARRAIDELASLGGPAVAPVLKAMDSPMPRGVNGIDGWESLFAVLRAMARMDPEPLIDLVLRDGLKSESQTLAVVIALRGCRRTDRAVEVLVAASRHRNPHIREEAIRGLPRDPRSIEPVIRALRDRSSHVRYAAASVLNLSEFFRVPEAANELRRLLARKNLEAKEPGCYRKAKAALAKMEP